jgi:DNA polymerase
MKGVRDKISTFLREYLDIYGEDIFIDPDRIEKIRLSASEEGAVDRRSVPAVESETKISMVAESADRPLWQFKNQIKECTNCPLGHTRNTFVFGQGNENADIMFIGEAPGAEEDRTGIPFVGRAGQLLNKLLANIKINREAVFIANILKCRPPNNRDPQPAEVQQCIPYLHKQIELIKPKVIVALGRVAAQNLLNSTSALKQMRERLWQYQGVNMIVTYHPAAILRNMGLLTTATQDFKFILDTYQQAIKHES